MHRRRQKDQQNGRHELFLQDKAGRREADRDRDELADTVEHPRVIIGGRDKDKQGEDEVLRIFPEKIKKQKSLDHGEDQEIDMDVGAEKRTDDSCQGRESLVLRDRRHIGRKAAQ